ncbi:MAG: glycosyltransferase family 2 protein [Bacteroidetes bacterium]|nr:glycosyltransferase family 2 protein [Bacteroidota bacterium]
MDQQPSNPVISVIIPCYNGERYLKQTLESLLYQTFTAWECILVDDGSTDGSAALYQQYVSADPRFRYHHQKNAGATVARNTGVALARGEFIQLLDADDLLLPERFSVCLRQFEQHPETDAVYSEAVTYRDGEGFLRTLPAGIPLKDTVRAFLFELNVTFSILIHAFLFRKSILIQEPFDTALLSYGEDYDCWIRLAMRGAVFSHIDEVLVVYRFTSGSLTSQEATLVAAKLHVLNKYRGMERTAPYEELFQQTELYLQQRLVMGYFMERSFRSGWALLRAVWGPSSGSARLKMAGWGMLMLVPSSANRVRQ